MAFFQPGNGGLLGRALVASLIQMGTGVGQLIEQSFGGFFKARPFYDRAGALEIRGQNDAGEKSADCRKNDCDHTGKHRHLLFLTLLVLMAKMAGKILREQRPCRALHHLQRSVD